MALVERKKYRQQVEDSLAQFRVTALLGPRQCGKTTLAKTFAAGSQSYFDLEDPVDLARLARLEACMGRLARSKPTRTRFASRKAIKRAGSLADKWAPACQSAK